MVEVETHRSHRPMPMRCSHHRLGVRVPSLGPWEFVNDFLRCLGFCHNHPPCSTEKYLQCVPLAACAVLQRKFNGRSDMNTSGRPKNAGRLHSNPPADIKSRLGAFFCPNLPKTLQINLDHLLPTQSIHHISSHFITPESVLRARTLSSCKMPVVQTRSLSHLRQAGGHNRIGIQDRDQPTLGLTG